MSTRGDGSGGREALFDLFAEHVSAGKVATFRELGFDVVMGEREGARFKDRFDGRSFVNCHSNGGVFNLGHRHPRIRAALERALESLDIGNHHLVSPARAELARRLAKTTSGALPGVVFGVSGGEAVDLALKLARGLTGRPGIVSAVGGYHGHTGLALSTGDPSYRDPFGPQAPGYSQVPFDDLSAMDAAVTDETAAVILEPIPATLGMPIPREGYLRGVAELCRARGALFIVDEVQTGLGRTGKTWAHQHEGIEPDMIVTGKGLSGGYYPITATLMRAEHHAFFEKHPFVHISTFGGAELGCAVALEVLDILEEPGFLEHVEAIGRIFEEGFSSAPYALRRRGMMMALKFDNEIAGMMATKMLFDQGIFAIYANNDRSALQLLPPLILGEDEARALIGEIRRALG